MIRRRAAVGFLTAGTLAATACRRSPDPVQRHDAPLPVVNFDHLRHLTRNLMVSGHPVRVVALYANAPGYAPTGSPARDGFEGVACVDDAARAAVLYLRAYEASGDTRDRDEALGLLAFVMAMQQPNGEFVNFVDAAGRPNRRAASSRPSMSYWAARGIWALGESVRVLGVRDPALIPPLHAALDLATARLALDVDKGRLIGGSATATAEALLGLLALQRAEPSPAHAALASHTASLLVPLSRGGGTVAPWGARTDSAAAPWHTWGARATAALTDAGAVLQRPDFIVAARSEADGLWSRFLLAGEMPAQVAPDGSVRAFPEIAYAVSPIVDGYLALAAATGERRYSVMAGLAGAWLLGANPAGVAMYDARTGRTFDGLDGSAPAQLNRNAGAESTIEVLLALQALTRDPAAVAYLRYRAAGALAARLDAVPPQRTFVGPDGARVTLARATASGDDGLRLAEGRAGDLPVTLTYWPAANPIEVRLATLLASRWNAEHPDVQVRVQPLPAGRSSEEVLLAAIVARATPDISSNVSSALLARLVRAGGVVRLDDRAPTAARLAERTTPAMLSRLRLPDGGIYAMPWKTNPEMLMYNVDALAAAGIRPPRTHAELLMAFRRLARDADGDGHLDHWAMWAPLKTTWFERFYDFYPLYLASAGGKTLVDNGRIEFDNPAAIAALTVLRQGFAEGTLPRANFSLGRDPFVDGTVSMKIIGPWFVRELEALKAPGLHYAVAPMPVADGARADAGYAFADLRSIAIFSTTRHPDAAARVVAFLTSPEADQLLITEASQLPYRRGLASDTRFTTALARWPTLGTYARQVERTRDIDLDPDVVEIFDVLSEAYEAAGIYGVVPVSHALHHAALESQAIIDAR